MIQRPAIEPSFPIWTMAPKQFGGAAEAIVEVVSELVQRLLIAKKELRLEAELKRLDVFDAVILDDTTRKCS